MNVQRARTSLRRIGRHVNTALGYLEGDEPLDREPPPDHEPPPDREPPPPDREPPPPPPVRDNVIIASGGDALYTDQDVRLGNTVILAGYRSGIINSMGINHRVNVTLDSCKILSLDPNGPPDWDGNGSFWASRMYGIQNATVRQLLVKNLFGKYLSGPLDEKNTNEGHGLYWSLSPVDRSLYVFEGYRAVNMGGHPLYLTTASCDRDAINTARCGNAPPPMAGGKIVIRRCVFKNTDQSPARGAYSISLPDTYCETIIDQTEVIMDGPNYYKNGNLVASRGLLMAEGKSPSLLVKGSYFRAKPPSDRTAQVWIEGPDLVELTGSTFDCQQISINHPYGDKPDTVKTKRLRISGCRGDAEVLWQGESLGKVSDLNDEWVFVRPD